MKQKILLVDKDREYRQVMATIVRRVGYQVIQADEIADAMKRALSERPDLIMMDPSLLATNGDDLAAWLRSSPFPAGIPLFIYTTQDAGSWRDEVLCSGVVEILTKPIPPTEVQQALSKRLPASRNRPRPIPSPCFEPRDS